MDVFILCGQSNMAGRGDLSSLSPTSTSSNHKSSGSTATDVSGRTVINGHEILCFGADNEWMTAMDPLHYDKPEKVGVGPGLSFAKLIAKLDILENNRKIGLIPCAVGSSSIRQWLPYSVDIEMDHETKQSEDPNTTTLTSNGAEDGLFEIAIARTKLAMHTPFESVSKRQSVIYRNGYHPDVISEDMTGDELHDIDSHHELDIELKGILWHQGESDCDSQQNANLYTEAITILFEHFRKELGEDNVPILVGGLGDFLGQNKSNRFTFYNVINTALMSLPQRLHNVGYVSSAGLMHKGDYLHFDAESARILGHRYGEKYAQLSGMVTREELSKYMRFNKFKKMAIAKTRRISWTSWLLGTAFIVGSVCAYKLYLDRKGTEHREGTQHEKGKE